MCNVIKRKIGILGGTFNPIHIGHLIMGERAYEELGLDVVWIMPSNNPPHKDNDELVSDEARIEMVKMAIQGNQHFSLSTFEFERSGYTYTADTLIELSKRYPECEFYFIIGGDSLVALETWSRPNIIFEKANIVATSRDGMTSEEIKRQILYLEEKYHGKIYLLSIPRIDISSHMIRTCIKQEKSVAYYTPSSVVSYIKEHNLYL